MTLRVVLTIVSNNSFECGDGVEENDDNNDEDGNNHDCIYLNDDDDNDRDDDDGDGDDGNNDGDKYNDDVKMMMLVMLNIHTPRESTAASISSIQPSIVA